MAGDAFDRRSTVSYVVILGSSLILRCFNVTMSLLSLLLVTMSFMLIVNTLRLIITLLERKPFAKTPQSSLSSLKIKLSIYLRKFYLPNSFRSVVENSWLLSRHEFEGGASLGFYPKTRFVNVKLLYCSIKLLLKVLFNKLLLNKSFTYFKTQNTINKDP